MKRIWIFLVMLLALAVLGHGQAPIPMVNQPLVPDTVAPGGPDLTLTVNGTGFVSNSVVNWNGSPLSTTFVSMSQVKATIPAVDTAVAGTGWLTVVNPAPGGGKSNLCFFPVTANVGTTIGFSVNSTVTVGNYPEAAAVGDFNGDGKLDLAIANSYDNTVSILLGDGTGNFSVVSTPSVTYFPVGIAVGDFNGDGKLDLAVVGYTGISVLLGDGTGNFTVLSGPHLGYVPDAIAAGDFNGDGNLDLAVVTECGTIVNCNGQTPGNVSILLGDGTGNFTTASTPNVGDIPVAVAAGDFNGDGKLDLAVSNYLGNSVSILLGDGTGNFTPASTVPAGQYLGSLATADFNGDGKLDLAVVSVSGYSVLILLGDGTGNFTPSSSGVTGSAYKFALGDFNGDGNIDLGAAPPDVLLGNGAGGFTGISFPFPGYDPSGVAVGDFNGDGRLDLAVVNMCGNSSCSAPGTVSIMLQLPPGTPAAIVSPTSLSFGTQQVLTTSASQWVNLTNTGTATLDITSITASPNFSQTNYCGASLPVGGTCLIEVSFDPHVIGNLKGAITITDNTPAGAQTISLSGVGTVVTLSPASLNFGSLPVGTTSSPQTVTVTNNGRHTLQYGGIGFAGQEGYAQTNTCATGIPAMGSCTVTVTFTPTTKGTKNATLNIHDNGGGSPQGVALTGKGT